MKKILAFLITLIIIICTVPVFADQYKDKSYNMNAVNTVAIFSQEATFKMMGEEPVLMFDKPVTMTFKGDADNGLFTDITLLKFDNTGIEYEIAENYLSDIITYLDGNLTETQINEGAHLLVLSTKDEDKGSYVFIVVGEPEIYNSDENPPDVPVTNNNPNLSDWAVSEVSEAFDIGLITQELYSGNNFKRQITRGEFAHVMAKLLEKCNISYDKYIKSLGANPVSKFTDTNNDLVIDFVSSCGIIKGMGDAIFSPDGLLTREQAASMLSRTASYLKIKIPSITAEEYVDSPAFSSWSYNDIYTVAKIKDKKNNLAVMGGMGEGYFSPAYGYSVEQALITVKRLYNAI